MALERQAPIDTTAQTPSSPLEAFLKIYPRDSKIIKAIKDRADITDEEAVDLLIYHRVANGYTQVSRIAQLLGISFEEADERIGRVLLTCGERFDELEWDTQDEIPVTDTSRLPPEDKEDKRARPLRLVVAEEQPTRPREFETVDYRNAIKAKKFTRIDPAVKAPLINEDEEGK